MAKSKKDPNFPMQGKGGNMGGRYSNKAMNLTAKQLAKQKAVKASKARTVDISQTTRGKNGKLDGKTYGPGGKPLTGTVTMGNGNTAVYKDGKRVTNAPKAKPKPAAPSRSSSSSRPSSSSSSSSASKPAAPKGPNGGRTVAVGTVKKGPNGKANRWNGKAWVPVTPKPTPAKPAGGQTAAQAAAASSVANINYGPNSSAPKKPSPGRQYKPIAVSGPTAMPQKDPGKIPGISGQKPPPPEKRRERRAGGNIVTEALRNGRWVVVSTRRA